jgi:uncharacterized membrane protein
MNKSPLVTTVIASAVALGVSMASSSALAASHKGMEKCYGVVKAGKNDCGAKGHSCAGQAKKNNDPNEWIYLPTGTCEKIVGGVVKNKK